MPGAAGSPGAGAAGGGGGAAVSAIAAALPGHSGATRRGSGGNALRAFGSGLTQAGCRARPRLVPGLPGAKLGVFLVISLFVFTDKIKIYKNENNNN